MLEENYNPPVTLALLVTSRTVDGTSGKRKSSERVEADSTRAETFIRNVASRRLLVRTHRT